MMSALLAVGANFKSGMSTLANQRACSAKSPGLPLLLLREAATCLCVFLAYSKISALENVCPENTAVREECYGEIFYKN